MNLKVAFCSLARQFFFLSADGQMQAWGDNGVGNLGLGHQAYLNGCTTLTLPPDSFGRPCELVDFACGMEHSLALTKEGQLFSWGNNSYGQLGRSTTSSSPLLVSFPDPNTRVVQVACGAFYSAALTDDGSVYTWGSNSYRQLGDIVNSGNRSSPEKV
jgi:alpha-tubulin suppressor-like RCC1 family protein